MIEIFKSDAHLWLARHDDFDTFKLKRTSLKWLTEIELIRLNRCYDERHRTQYILGRLLIRNVLSQYSYLEPWCWRFGENKFGKPILDPMYEQDLSFNLSHSDNCLVVVVSRSNELGVDIERNDKPRRVVRIARRYFANSEMKELFGLSDSEQLSRFYDLWTLKEAYAKARGFGLAIPFRQFSFAFSGEKLSMSFSKDVADEPANWQIWQMSYAPYKIALAVKGDTEITNIVSRKFLTLTSHEFETCSIIRST